MDGLVCPRLAGFLRLTQKLKAKIQKKKDSSGKDLCPICGCKSNKGNLCQACFMRSFKPIAYARNIKVVEQKEFFYGPGKDGRWRCKKRSEATCGTYKKKGEIEMAFGSSLKMVMSSTDAFGNPLGSSDTVDNSAGCNSDSDRASDKDRPDTVDPSEPRTPNFDEFKPVELIPSSELVKIDLVDVNTNTQTEEEALEPIPKFVPDFWESPVEEDINQSMTSKLKTFTDHVIKEARRPFKEIFCDSNTNIIAPGDSRGHEGTDANFSADVYEEVLQNLQQKVSTPHRIECSQSVDTETQCISAAADVQDRLTFSKQLKQNAILQLLKVAFKTNLILNNLFQYFKKVVESDGSNSENSESDQKPQLGNDNGAADSKISVDTFFFPNRQSAILWGVKSGTRHPEPGRAGEPSFPVDGERPSDTEVIYESQATLSMLMNQTAWNQFRDEVPPESDHQGDVLGPCPGRQSIFASHSPADRFATRKFHSEHSKLRLKHEHEQGNESNGGLSWTSSDLEFQPSSVIVANGPVAYRGNSRGNPGSAEEPSSAGGSNQSGKSLLDLVFGLNRTCVKPSLLPLPECQQDLITLSSPEPSKDDILLEPSTRKDADSQTALSSRHLEQEMNLLHKAFLDQLAHFSIQLVESCKTFGHSWQTSFLAELVEHFRTACSIISSIVGESSCQAMPSSDRLDELQDVSNQISICLAKLRAHPHSFVGDCSDHDISTLLSSPPDQSDLCLINTWV